MWKTINDILVNIDNLVWGIPLMVLILAGGILLTVRLGVMQFRKLPLALKWMVKNFKFFCPLYSPKRDDWNR